MSDWRECGTSSAVWERLSGCRAGRPRGQEQEVSEGAPGALPSIPKQPSSAWAAGSRLASLPALRHRRVGRCEALLHPCGPARACTTHTDTWSTPAPPASPVRSVQKLSRPPAALRAGSEGPTMSGAWRALLCERPSAAGAPQRLRGPALPPPGCLWHPAAPAAVHRPVLTPREGAAAPCAPRWATRRRRLAAAATNTQAPCAPALQAGRHQPSPGSERAAARPLGAQRMGCPSRGSGLRAPPRPR